jgi:hypothetical protein
MLFCFHHCATGVVATIGANDVRGLLRAAFWAGLKLFGLQGVVRAAHAGAGVGLFALGDGHGGNLSEILASKGFGESTSLCGGATERQGRENNVIERRNLSGDWQLPAGLKIIWRFRRFCGAHSDDAM